LILRGLEHEQLGLGDLDLRLELIELILRDEPLLKQRRPQVALTLQVA